MYGIKIEILDGYLWLIDLPPGVHFENPSLVLFETFQEADQWARDNGWKNFIVKEYTAK
jgi:hypothetical protein